MCQKYEMDSVQSSIRAEVNSGGFPAPKGAEFFATYAIASAKDLIPETRNAARRTLDHPMTFEILGVGLRFFEGWALRATLPSTASAVETALSRALTYSSTSNLQDLRTFGLAVPRLCLIPITMDINRIVFSPDGLLKYSHGTRTT